MVLLKFKNRWLKLLGYVFLFVLFSVIISCEGKNSNTTDYKALEKKIENLEYVQGKGYCVKKYDEKGCNICSLEHGWMCTLVYCSKTDEEKVNQCTEYLSKEELLKKMKE